MSCSKELVRGLIVSGAGVAGIGTAVDIAGLFAVGAAKTFNEITVYNDADKAVKVAWTNDSTGESEDFVVPHGGKSYTRILNVGNITSASLKVYSLTEVAAAGNITINLAANR